MKFATRNFYSFPPHLDYVATQSWEVKSPYLLKITKDTTQNRTGCDKNETLHRVSEKNTHSYCWL